MILIKNIKVVFLIIFLNFFGINYYANSKENNSLIQKKQNLKESKKNDDKEKKSNSDKDKNNKNLKYDTDIKASVFTDMQYFYVKQSSDYEKDILQKSPSEMNQHYLLKNNRKAAIFLGKMDINPEFNYYNVKDNQEREKIISIGFKISQPFFNAKKNVDPRFASQEYFYIKTKYLQFQIGSVNSVASKMRVDGQNIASGAGGIYGTWWRYVSLPVFNISNDGARDPNILNALSPIYILYPTLPNEAGFTSQRNPVENIFSNENLINGNVNINNPINGVTTQGYPTQGAYSNKISLFSKRISGFSVGLSYSPTTANTGFITRAINRDMQKISNLSGGFVRNYTSVGLDYRKQFDRYGIGVALSFTYEYGESSPLKYTNSNSFQNQTSVISNNSYYNRHNLNAYALGAQIIYKNYSFAYSYGDWGLSLLNKYILNQFGEYQRAIGNKKSFYHTVSFGADYGIARVGTNYMCSSFSGYKLDVWSIGFDLRTITLGFFRIQPYIEYLGYIFHTQNVKVFNDSEQVYKASGNRGYVITLGFRVVF